YFSMVAIALVNLVIHVSDLSSSYLFAFSLSATLWLMCAGAAFANIWFVQNTDLKKLHFTISLFFIANAVVTLIQFGMIMWDAGSLNPFIYQGMHQKYFVNSGDLMKGISFDFSTTNAVLNSFGVVYFLSRNKPYLVLLGMVALLLTASNF